MNANLTATATAPAIPRRWNVEVDGIRWLPRMIDKARMQAAGRLGAYLLGHSPVDRALLRLLRMTTAEFAALAVGNADDAGVLAGLRARGFDEAGVRHWSERFQLKYAGLIPLWDVDDGYRKPTLFELPLITTWRMVEGPVMEMMRRVSKAP